jgi:hypothetical protein
LAKGMNASPIGEATEALRPRGEVGDKKKDNRFKNFLEDTGFHN